MFFQVKKKKGFTSGPQAHLSEEKEEMERERGRKIKARELKLLE